ncbi:nicotinamidase-related amidase [Catalinimonas alkaloidigena]|uniref:isochorismatase family protein n=1 Tax=Catalinimonas alkaloidigena TaxID=1075417 RepID=UPI002405A546|nr:isochorismatase family protein [Catalinimonas alkaloidigena]MDF9799412.1 nicotinamidase-related amidase [Catalinimonas alkaloidigena]
MLQLVLHFTLIMLTATEMTDSGWIDKEEEKYHLNLRSRTEAEDGTFNLEEKEVIWEPRKTAFIICDMWDKHWCKSANRRVGELAGPMNEIIKEVRKQGSLIIHAPSSVTSFYEDTPQRQKARQAAFVKTPKPLSTSQRWGTAWCWPDETREEALPIDDSDMGCDCAVKCEIRDAWTRQIASIEIAPDDAITDNGQETFNLLAQHEIENVVLLGVHLNMCVLGRPFGIRQMVQQGKNVVLMRDMTDTMYNPEMEPQVSHVEGTELVIAHIEKYWCPSFASSDLTGKPAFSFK